MAAWGRGCLLGRRRPCFSLPCHHWGWFARPPCVPAMKDSCLRPRQRARRRPTASFKTSPQVSHNRAFSAGDASTPRAEQQGVSEGGCCDGEPLKAHRCRHVFTFLGGFRGAGAAKTHLSAFLLLSCQDVLCFNLYLHAHVCNQMWACCSKLYLLHGILMSGPPGFVGSCLEDSQEESVDSLLYISNVWLYLSVFKTKAPLTAVEKSLSTTGSWVCLAVLSVNTYS